MAAALVSGVLLVAVPVPARAAEPVEFVDTRPVVIDLDDAAPGDRWRVPVLGGLPGRGHTVYLSVTFRPAGVLRVEPPRITLGEGQVGDFVLTLQRAVPGSGELILSGGGAIVRRAISTANRPGQSPVPVSRLEFAGVRLAPFSERVRIGSVTVRGAPGDPRGGRLGLLTSGRGDTAEVVRTGATFTVTGAGGIGEYRGAVDLMPGVPGGEADGVLRVRDLPVWPLLVLVLGLLVVHVLDRYQQRGRPRQLLDLRLARLRDRAHAAQRDVDQAYRIVAAPGEPGLLLDRLVADAGVRFQQQLTDADRAAWEAGGAEYRRVADPVEAFETLAETVRALTAERAATAGDAAAERALDRSPVGRALRGRALPSLVDLTDATAQVIAARTYLRDFRRLHRVATEMRAGDLLAKLRTGPESLAALEAEIEDRYRQWQPGPEGIPDHAVPPPGRSGYPQAAPGEAVRSRRWGVLAGTTAVLLLLPCLLLVVLLRDDGNPPAGTGPPPTASGPAPSRTSALPELPASPAPRPAPARAAGPAAPTTTELVVFGAVLPLLLAGAAIAGARLARQWWRPRRTGPDTDALDRRVRQADRRFALAGGALVVLSGMSVLYFGNPAFGTAGDYLAIALWGTAFGEGLTLARRLWPQPA
jgi:hypothetical protein